MTDKFAFFKLLCGTIVAIGMLFFIVIGVQTIWTDYVVTDYDKHLTEQVYVDVAVNKNVNLVFYKKGCPYCEKGKKAVIDAAKKSRYQTFYIDVESEAGQLLVKKYQVEKAATLVTIRGNNSELYHYAIRNKEDKIVTNNIAIKEILDD